MHVSRSVYANTGASGRHSPTEPPRVGNRRNPDAPLRPRLCLLLTLAPSYQTAQGVLTGRCMPRGASRRHAFLLGWSPAVWGQGVGCWVCGAPLPAHHHCLPAGAPHGGTQREGGCLFGKVHAWSPRLVCRAVPAFSCSHHAWGPHVFWAERYPGSPRMCALGAGPVRLLAVGPHPAVVLLGACPVHPPVCPVSACQCAPCQGHTRGLTGGSTAHLAQRV